MELIRENQARVLAGTGSPKIALGAIAGLGSITWHVFPLIRMGASVVMLTEERTRAHAPDMLFCDPRVPISLQFLPSRWKPDFFLDTQAEHGHWLPVGLGDLPIPTIATYSHPFLGQVLRHMEGLFDCLVKPSEQLRFGDAYVPFGGSWGTMDERIGMIGSKPAAVRDVTVSCTLGTSGAGEKSVRFLVLEELRRIQERRKDWRIEIVHGLKMRDYLDLLGRSKVSICVGAWGCAMTYRPLEILAMESSLLHVDEDAYGSTAKLSEFFPADWYTLGTAATLEESIEAALKKDDAERARIHQALIAEYSYERQYRRLFEVAGSASIGERLSRADWSRRAYAVNALVDFPEASVHRWALTAADLETKNRYAKRDVCLWSPKEKEHRYRWQTELALRERDPWDVYEKYAEMEA